MTFLADDKLDYYVKKKTRASFFSFLAMVFLLILISLKFYYSASSTGEFIAESIGGFIIFLACIYSMTIIEGKKLNKLVNEIIIVNDKFIFTTYAYKWLINIITPKTIELNKADLNIQEVDFPFNSLGLTDNRTYCLTLGEMKFFVCYECFPDELKGKLQPN